MMHLQASEIPAALTDDKVASQNALASHACDAVTKEYILLEEAIKDPSKRGSTYTQPWLKVPAMSH
jgi:hypothetical protein